MAFAADKVSAHSFAWEIELTAILANFGLPPANVHALLNAAAFRQPLPTYEFAKCILGSSSRDDVDFPPRRLGADKTFGDSTSGLLGGRPRGSGT